MQFSDCGRAVSQVKTTCEMNTASKKMTPTTRILRMINNVIYNQNITVWNILISIQPISKPNFDFDKYKKHT